MKKIKKSPLSILYSVLIFLFLYAPIAVLIVYSFNANKSRGSWRSEERRVGKECAA